MTHYRAPVKVSFAGTSEWVHADSEAQAATRIAMLVGREVAQQLGIPEDRVHVEVGKAEEWLTYAPSQEPPPPAPKPPVATPAAPGRAFDTQKEGRRVGAGARKRAPSRK